MKRAVAEGDDPAKSWSLGVLRWLDPAGLLERLHKTRFEHGTRADYLRGQAALGMAAADPDEAAAVAESIADPAERAGTLVDLADATPAADRARKLALLDRAALQRARRGISSNKLFQMGEVAERWLELGETRKAQSLFADGRKLVETLPPQKRTDAGSFLARMARVEPAASLGLVENVGPMRWRERTYGNIAIRLAFEHPAEAEAVLNRIQEPTWRVFGAPRICRRLARNDLARARRIADALPYPAERAYAWTFLADGLAATDRTAASAALDRAFREIDSIDAGDLIAGERGEPGGFHHADGGAHRARPRRRGLLAGRRPMLARRRPAHRLRPRLALAGRGAAALPLRPRARRRRSSSRSRPSSGAARSATVTTSSRSCSWPWLASIPGPPSRWSKACRAAKTPNVSDPTNWARITVAEILAKPPERRWMGVWRFYSGCGIAMFEEVYREL